MFIWLEIRKAVQEKHLSKMNSVEFLLWSRDKDYDTVKLRIEEIKNLGGGKREIFTTEEEMKQLDKNSTMMQGR